MSALAGGKYGKQICGGYYHDGFICVGYFYDGMRLEWSEFVDVGVLMDQGDGVQVHGPVPPFLLCGALSEVFSSLV